MSSTSEEVIAITKRAWTRAESEAEPLRMTQAELGGFLNLLLEAERAGAKLISAYLDELPLESARWAGMRAVQLDEARNCAVLLHLLLEAEVTPTPAVGDFYGRGLAIRGWRERVEFLNRGQAWVARRLAAELPRVPENARAALQAMLESHVANIGSCEALL
jgi:nitronate monooxygenase